MEAFFFDWLNLLGRWVHFVTGIAWIGASFYFIWLDNHLEIPKDLSDKEKGVGGEVWSVHGGGFYRAEKYQVAPDKLPETLHWFKWEAYTTWLSGMFLLALVYWYGAEIYLIDSSVADLSQLSAVGISVFTIAGSWIVYDALCKSRLGQSETAFGAVLFALSVLLAWGFCQLYSGRGAYIHFGAVLGTIMVANVYFVIIPGQRRMVEAFESQIEPNPADGIRAKQRSVHNTYLTLPVLFTMTSNHYALTYSHQYNWLILVAFTLAGALIRVWFVARHKKKGSPLLIVIALVILLAVAFSIMPKSRATLAAEVTLDTIRPVIRSRCTVCHSKSPSHIAFPAAPLGIMLDTDTQILAEADRIHQQTVVFKAMPIGNLTVMNESERALIDTWYFSRNE